jgi:hypothetical protein
MEDALFKHYISIFGAPQQRNFTLNWDDLGLPTIRPHAA